MRCAMCRCFCVRDHPREYGENHTAALATVAFQGSSPRIRGECGHGHFTPRLSGIIPANTGRMSPPFWTCTGAWDHPREYGENPLSPSESAGRSGSSPRIRGEYSALVIWKARKGIIPANTGRIVNHLSHSIRAADHPREYGENRGLTCIMAL